MFEYIIIAGLVAAAGAGGVLFFLKRKKSKDKDEQREIARQYGGAMAAPHGWIAFCQKYPEFPGAEWVNGDDPGVKLVPLNDDANQLLLRTVQNEVQSEMTYQTDQRQYNKPEAWVISGTGYGDCEDFAILKKARLVERGFPKSALTFASCWTETGEYHAVLLAHTANQIYVLDNRFSKIKKFEDLPYKWQGREVPGTKTWISMQ